VYVYGGRNLQRVTEAKKRDGKGEGKEGREKENTMG